MSEQETLAFEVLGKLGSGGMGRVELARRANDVTGALIAVKRLHEDLANDPEFVQMFVDEARITASIQHENVVNLVGWGIDQAGLFLATEFVRGASLRDLERTAPLEQELAAWVCARAASGLHAAHTRGIIHRDVSPANILAGTRGEVKIADFGIARALSSTRRTQSGVLKGKIPYMSVEQLRGEPAEPRSDLYSLGVVLYEAIAGERPHGDADDVELLARIVSTPIPSLAERVPSADPELVAIVDALLSPAREDRPHDGLELARALDDWLAKRGASPKQLAAALGARVVGCERGSHRQAEEIEERELSDDAYEVLTVNTNMSAIRPRDAAKKPKSITPNARTLKNLGEQPLAMLVTGAFVGLGVAVLVGQVATKKPEAHKETAPPALRNLHGQIQCGDTLTCNGSGAICCEHTVTGRFECVANVLSCSNEGDVPIRCSDKAGCVAQGMPNAVCCAHAALFSGQVCTRPIEVSCQPSCSPVDHIKVGCSPSTCGANEVCVNSTCSMPGYDICVAR
jgi:serine/threonine protein kinase